MHHLETADSKSRVGALESGPDLVAAARRAAIHAVQSLEQPEGRNVDWTGVTRELLQLRPVLNQLLALAARNQSLPSQPPTRSVGTVIREAVLRLSSLAAATGREFELELLDPPWALAVGEELAAAIRALLEAALSTGSGPIRIRERISQERKNDTYLVVELLNDGFDVPDHVRRKLSRAVGAHAGQTGFVTTLAGTSVSFRIPMVQTIEAEAA